MTVDVERDRANGTTAPDDWVPRGIAARQTVRPTDDASEFSVVTAGDAERAGAARDNGGGMDLNSISFEGLRTLGFSVAEAARFISYRQRRGGRLRSLTEVDSVTGLGDELRAWLTQHGSI